MRHSCRGSATALDDIAKSHVSNRSLARPTSDLRAANRSGTSFSKLRAASSTTIDLRFDFTLTACFCLTSLHFFTPTLTSNARRMELRLSMDFARRMSPIMRSHLALLLASLSLLPAVTFQQQQQPKTTQASHVCDRQLLVSSAHTTRLPRSRLVE